MDKKSEILDNHYQPNMHWKVINRNNVLAAMEEYAQHIASEKWVKVEDGLPENGHVLGCMEDTDSIYICYYNNRKGFQVWGLGREQPITDMKVTHWQPLPPPPNK